MSNVGSHDNVPTFHVFPGSLPYELNKNTISSRAIEMSEFGPPQIPKPTDEQAFERCNVILWRCVLKDPTAQAYGRRGQRQYGVDILGCRDGRPEKPVGIQCKLKGGGKLLSEKEVRDEVEKAMGFNPPLSEYIIVTTAPNDTSLQSLALELSKAKSEQLKRKLKITIYGWESLQQEIRGYPEAHKAFDPSYTPRTERIEQRIEDLHTKFDTFAVSDSRVVGGDNPVPTATPVELDHAEISAEYHQLIDAIRELLATNPNAALDLLLKLQERLGDNASVYIRFRVATNIAACRLELGDVETAATAFIAAWELAPDDPRAIANKALGFLLRDDCHAAKGYAESMLSEHPDNAALAAYYIHSLKRDDTVGDPITHVPEAVRKTPEVAGAYVAWLMERGAPGSWWDVAIAAHCDHPDSDELADKCADALLSRAIGGDRFVHSHVLEDAALADIDKAIELYESLWPEVRDHKVRRRGDQNSIALNLMVAYRLRGRNEESTKTANEALERFPDDIILKEHAAVIFFEKRETKRALELISDLEINEQTASLRLNIGIVEEDWDAVADIVDNHLESFAESERNLAQATRILSRVETVPEDKRLPLLEDAQSKFNGDTRALTLLAQTARLNELDDLSNAYFNAATSAFSGGDDSRSSRCCLAAEAMARQELNVVADTLNDHVRLDHVSEELRMLARALVYDVPIRQRALRFFYGLAPELRSLPYFQRLEGVLNFNRGMYRDAVALFSAAFELEPCLENILDLIRSLVMIGNKDSVASLLEREGVDALPGSHLERIEFSHALAQFGKYQRALNLGYQALCYGVDVPDIVLGYFGLVLNSTWERQDHGFDGTVDSGVWVRLTESNGDSFEALIGESSDRPWGQKVDPTNPFIAKSLGLRVDDVFEYANPLGPAKIWTISEVKPIWLHAFHYLTRSFGQRFPETPGFVSLTLHEDDFEPILEQVRRQSHAAGVRAELYLEKGLPIAVAAGDMPGGGIAFAEYLYSAGMQLRVFSGTAEDRKGALALIKDHACSGAVLDALTAWHAATLDIFPVLQERLGPLAIPISELRRIKEMTTVSSSVGDGRSMHIGYRDGKFVGYTETADERAEKLKELQARIAKIEEACEVEPIEFPDHFSELGELLVGLPPRDAFAPAVMAGKKRLLLCEDLMMRQLAGKAFDTKGVWLQAVLMSAEQTGEISQNEHSDAVVYLAAHRHGPVSLNRQLLLSAFERDESPDLSNLQALCTYIGHTGSDLQSHVAIGAGFINTLWARARPLVVTSVPADSKTLKATDLVFRALIGDTDNDEWPKRAAALFGNLDEEPGRYLLRSCEAKFLSVDQIRKILRDEVD